MSFQELLTAKGKSGMTARAHSALIYTLLLSAILMTVLACSYGDRPTVTTTIEGEAGSIQEIKDWRPDFDELTWFETAEEAVVNNEISRWHDTVAEDETFKEVDKSIALFEGEERFTYFFRARNALGNDVVVRYFGWLKSTEDAVYYSAATGGGGMSWEFFKDSVRRMRIDEVGEVRMCFNLFNSNQLGAVDDTKIFIWGLSQTPRIKTMRIEGQSPTNIIPLELDGEQAFFWYFEDLQTDKPITFQDLRQHTEGELIITMDD